jgi:hypothetical protein
MGFMVLEVGAEGAQIRGALKLILSAMELVLPRQDAEKAGLQLEQKQILLGLLILILFVQEFPLIKQVIADIIEP